jgi:hypothetical protein
MPRPKSVKSYPSAYLEYAQALSERPDMRITVEFEDDHEAKSFRLDFNSFKGAAVREGLDKMFPEIAAFYVEVNGNKAIVQHKDHTDQAEKMRKALNKAQMNKLVKGV